MLLFLYSCSSGPHWIFGSGLSQAIYYESDWNCYYDDLGEEFYVECHNKDTNDLNYFYTTKVRYIK